MSETILCTRDGGLARVTLNRPHALNAMNFEMGARWRELARELTADPEIGAILIEGAGPAFCAGGDVIAMAGAGSSGNEITRMAQVIHEGIRVLIDSATPIVASVNGAVAGGGLGLMLCADYIVASPRATFVSKYANIGLTPDLGVSTLLPAAIGRTRALRLLLQDVTVDAETALDWGLVSEIAADPGARADEIARFWGEGATWAFGQAKRLVRGSSLASAFDDEARTIGVAFETAESRARVAAFAAASRGSRGAS